MNLCDDNPVKVAALCATWAEEALSQDLKVPGMVEAFGLARELRKLILGTFDVGL